MFSGFGTNGEYGPDGQHMREMNEIPQMPVLPNSAPDNHMGPPQTHPGRMNEFTFNEYVNHFDPHSEDINTQGVYDPGKVDGYVDQLHDR